MQRPRHANGDFSAIRDEHLAKRLGHSPTISTLGGAAPFEPAREIGYGKRAVAERNLTFDFTAPPPAAPGSEGATTEGPRTLSVGELDRAIRGMLEGAFERAVWVEGEVTGMRPASSGHAYFCLKDEVEEASIDVVVYRTSLTPRARALLKDGARVRLRGKPTFWVPRGRLQLVADRVDAAGRGALLEALEKLKEKLAAEGLFAQERKRALPKEPRVIGVVTSATGAVIHDICKVAFRRGGARILLAAAQVQGQGAAESLCRALRALQRVNEVDVIVIGRGGGSSDDLSAFNDEALVRAVAACPVPIVSAVGHEVDVTLVDFAADQRASTPSQAAEMLVADTRARVAMIAQSRGRLVHAMRARFAEERVRLQVIERKIGDPRLAIASQQQRLDESVERLVGWSRVSIGARRERVARATARLGAQHPRLVIARERSAIVRASDRMTAVMRAALAKHRSTLGTSAAHLHAMSPLSVLGRGYAIATREDGHAIRNAADVAKGDRITVRVESAVVVANVTDVKGRE
jgi:exodeoxyribonuclease VII large subunit